MMGNNQDQNYNYLQGSDYPNAFAPQYEYAPIHPQLQFTPPAQPMQRQKPIKEKGIQPAKAVVVKSKQVKVACIGMKILF